jgi:hypothetical protein
MIILVLHTPVVVLEIQGLLVPGVTKYEPGPVVTGKWTYYRERAHNTLVTSIEPVCS